MGLSPRQRTTLLPPPHIIHGRAPDCHREHRMQGQQAQASLTLFLLASTRPASPQPARVPPRPYLQAKSRQAASKDHLVSRDFPAVQPVARDQLTSLPVFRVRQEASTLQARPSLLRVVSARWRPTTPHGPPLLDTGPRPPPQPHLQPTCSGRTSTRDSRRLSRLAPRHPRLTLPLSGTHPLHTGARQQVTAAVWELHQQHHKEPHHW